MILTDNYSNLFSSLTNGSLSKKNKITYKNSKKVLNILTIFMQEGFIRYFEVSKNNSSILNIYLKYNNNQPIFSKIIRISKPGRRFYIKNKDLFKSNHQGFYLLSTPKGVITSYQAKTNNLGGEIICQII